MSTRVPTSPTRPRHGPDGGAVAPAPRPPPGTLPVSLTCCKAQGSPCPEDKCAPGPGMRARWQRLSAPSGDSAHPDLRAVSRAPCTKGAGTKPTVRRGDKAHSEAHRPPQSSCLRPLSHSSSQQTPAVSPGRPKGHRLCTPTPGRCQQSADPGAPSLSLQTSTWG